MAGGGAEDLGLLALRTGGAIAPDVSYRLAGKYFYRDQLALPNGDPFNDSSRFGRTHFRIDSAPGKNELKFEVDAFRGFEGLPGRPDAKLSNWMLAWRGTRRRAWRRL